ncbi:MAG TPA: gamma-glutamyltransferase [Steroidobacteraceae bacterium]|nr:gamma-glutamyltransferase [Steroidobacteraceae bacterium]
MLRRLALAFCIVFVSIGSAAERVPGRPAIASAHPAATAAGLEMLEKGGNAFDAAVAVAAALTVVEPTGSGLGGGGFFLLHRSSDRLYTMIDAREKAPGASTRDMFLTASGEPDRTLATESGLAAGIPGEPAALEYLAQKYGRLPLATSLQPAIRLAREGFPLYARLQDGLRGKVKQLRRTRDATQAFLLKNEVPPVGYVIRQPELARTLELVAAHGAKGFYTGPVARRLVAGVKQFGGIWTEEDLAKYAVVEREPIINEYRGARIVSGSPPASGGIGLVDALNILEGFDLTKLDSATRKHAIIEAMRRAHRDRAVYLGDPDFVKIPTEMLTHQFYADGQRTSLRLDRALPSAMLSGIETEGGGPDTTHFSIIDTEGNRVAATLTLNLWLGTGLMAPGTGVLLNNQMDDFAIKAGAPNAFQLIGAEANAIEPGKRMLSSSTPTFVEAERGVLIAGSPGGSRIIGMVLLATLDFMSGRSPSEIVSAPRIHHQYVPDVVQFEPGALTPEEREALAARGHVLREGSRRWGNLQIVVWDYASGNVEAASDPRGAVGGVLY